MNYELSIRTIGHAYDGVVEIQIQTFDTVGTKIIITAIKTVKTSCVTHNCCTEFMGQNGRFRHLLLKVWHLLLYR